MLLAIDTSTTQAGIALYDGSVLAEMAWQAGRNHGRQVLPMIQRTIEMLGRTPADLTALAVARGPGSFTGLRVGLSVAKGLQLALGLPLYGYGSLEVLAHGQTLAGPVRAVMAMGRSRYATALFERQGNRYHKLGDTVGVDVESLVRLVTDETAIVGDLDSATRATIGQRQPDLWVASPAQGMRRPAILAELAWEDFQRDVPPAADAGEPIYLARE